MLADLAKWCVKFVTAASAIYYFRDAAGNPGLMVPYALCIALAAMVGAYIVRYWVKVMPARTITIISYVGMALFLFLIYIGYTNPTMVIVFMTCAQFFYGVAFASSPALYADTVTYTTWKTGSLRVFPGTVRRHRDLHHLEDRQERRRLDHGPAELAPEGGRVPARHHRRGGAGLRWLEG